VRGTAALAALHRPVNICRILASLAMRPVTFALLVAALSCSAGWASAEAVDPASCTAANTTSDQRIAACSEAIAASSATAHAIASAYAERGWAYEDKGQHEKAMGDVDEALRADPGSPKAFRVR